MKWVCHPPFSEAAPTAAGLAKWGIVWFPTGKDAAERIGM